MQQNRVGRDKAACLSPGIMVTNLKIHLQFVLTSSQDWPKAKVGNAFQTGIWPEEDLHSCSKAQVLSVLAVTGRIYNFSSLKKRNGDILSRMKSCTSILYIT